MKSKHKIVLLLGIFVIILIFVLKLLGAIGLVCFVISLSAGFGALYFMFSVIFEPNWSYFTSERDEKYNYLNYNYLEEVTTINHKIEDVRAKVDYDIKEATDIVKCVAPLVGWLFIFPSALSYASAQNWSFIAFIEALVANGFVWGIGVVGGMVIGYFVGKRIYKRKLRSWEDAFRKKETDVCGIDPKSAFVVGILIWLLCGAGTFLVSHWIPIVGPCLDRMDELKSEQEPDYDDYHDLYYFSLFRLVTLQLVAAPLARLGCSCWSGAVDFSKNSEEVFGLY